MTRTGRTVVLSLVAATATTLLGYFLTHPQLARDPVVPEGTTALATWLRDHPADAIAASALSDAALDSNAAQRRQLWLASYAHASHLSPRRPNAAAGFVRAGLFHWYELDDADRRHVLDVAAPLMREPRFFERMYKPIWSLTRNFAYLRRVAPETLNALDTLRELAVVRGLFPEYRELRETIRRRRLEEVQAHRANTVHPGEMLEFLPRSLDAADAPIARAILEELDRKPFAPEQIGGRIDAVAVLALDHDLGPLLGLAPLLEVHGSLRDVTRARVALAIENPALASRVEISTEVPGAIEWMPYHLERATYEARKGEAALAEAQLSDARQIALTSSVAATKLDVATLLRNDVVAEAARAELAAFAVQPIAWSNLCGPNELCSLVTAERYVATADETIALAMSVSQSDETPPYVEIYSNDVLVAEGEVRAERTFTFRPGAGVQRLEIRLVNPMTRNGVQRRLRLS